MSVRWRIVRPFLAAIWRSVLRRGSGGLCEDPNETHSGTFFPSPDENGRLNISTLIDWLIWQKKEVQQEEWKNIKQNTDGEKAQEGGRGSRSIPYAIKSVFLKKSWALKRRVHWPSQVKSKPWTLLKLCFMPKSVKNPNRFLRNYCTT